MVESAQVSWPKPGVHIPRFSGSLGAEPEQPEAADALYKGGHSAEFPKVEIEKLLRGYAMPMKPPDRLQQARARSGPSTVLLWPPWGAKIWKGSSAEAR